MGVCTSAYPDFRLSHCPPSRISNAASPRQRCYSTERHVNTWCSDTTPPVDVSVAVSSWRFKFARFEVWRQRLGKRHSKKKNLPLTHWLAKVAAKIRTLFISTKGKTFFTEKILSTYILCFFHTKITITLILPRLTKPKQAVNQHIKSHIYIYRTKESGKSIKKRIPYKLTEKQTKSSKISVIIDKIKKKNTLRMNSKRPK